MNEPTYYFDVLPLHPRPEPLESLTSYLMRLAELNGISHYSDLAYRLFPDSTSMKMLLAADHVPATFGRLVPETLCSEATLLATTFYHLGRKFSRCVKARTLATFLNSTVAYHLRYCPHCLDEQPYYRLPWRFLSLLGCPEHGCQLLDRCLACGQVISLFPRTLKVGVCPYCDNRLSTASSQPRRLLGSLEQQGNDETYRDLVFLLSPQPWETAGEETIAAVGAEFERLRWKTGYSPRAISLQTSLSSRSIRTVERGKFGVLGATFQSYLRYARFLTIPLRQIFLDGLANYEPLPDGHLTHEMQLTIRLQKGIDRIQSSGRPVNNATLRETTGLSRRTFWIYPTTRAMLEQLQAKADQQREKKLLAQVKEIIRQRRAEGKAVHRADIYRTLRISANGLKAYPSISDYLRDLNFPPDHRKPVRAGRCEQTLLGQVEQVIQQMVNRGQPFNQEAVAEQVGMGVDQLRRYPRVKQVLKQVSVLRFEQRQAQLLEQVETAISHLQATGQPVNRVTVIGLTGLSYHLLTNYPAVNDLLSRIQKTQVGQEKDSRTNAVIQAIASLKQKGKIITQTAICQTAGLSANAPSHHPDIRELIRPVLAEETQRHEQCLVEQATKAIQYLTAHNQPISIPAVGAIIGLSDSRLWWFPRVTALIREAKADARERYENDLVRRIHDAIHDLRSAGLPLTQKKICEVIDLPVVNLVYYHRAKEAIDEVARQFHQEQNTPWRNRYRSGL